MKYLLIGFVLLFFSELTVAQSVFNIIPLITTRSEVRELFREVQIVADNRSDVVFIKDARVTINYSTDRCNDSSIGRWDVDKDVVTYLEIQFKKARPISRLPFDLSKFNIRPSDDDLPGRLNYLSEELGVSFDVETAKAKERPAVTSRVHVFPSRSQYYLKCT